MATVHGRGCLLYFSLGVVALASCKSHNPDVGDGGGIDTSPPIDAYYCTASAMCMDPDKPACELDNGQCYACTATNIGVCANTTPVCGSDNTCEACSAHSQCPMDVCLSTGACDDGSDVAYIQGSGGSASPGSGSACTFAAPCGTFADALATGRPIIKVAGTVNEAVSVGSGSVTVYADPGATLKGATAGPALRVSGTVTAVTVYDLTITSGVNDPASIGVVIPSASGAPTVTLIGVTVSNNPGGGINEGGGTLAISQSTIKGNTGGGLSISAGQFDIENNFIIGNGGTDTGDTIGGAYFASLSTAGNVFAFNTVTANSAATGNTAGVYCGVVSVAAALDSDIVYANGAGEQFGSGFSGTARCSAIYSDIGGLGSAAGSNSFDADPMFKNTATGDYHLLAGSPCIGAADPSTSITVDFDGDARPQAGKWDVGADEYTGSGG